MTDPFFSEVSSAGDIRRILMIGTCRIYRSGYRMRRDNVTVALSPHRFHTLKQIELALRYHNGEEVLPKELTHTLSRRALEIVTTEPEPFRMIAALRDDVPPLDSFDAYVIEVSALKEHYATPEGGSEVLINSLVTGDLVLLAEQLEPFYETGQLRRLSNFRTELTSTQEARASMRRIKNFLGGKPILWVSHANIESPSPEEESLFNVRARLASILQTGATSMVDMFYNPTALAAAMGRRAFFEDRGRDLVHYTRNGQNALADALVTLAAPDAHPAQAEEPLGDQDDDGD